MYCIWVFAWDGNCLMTLRGHYNRSGMLNGKWNHSKNIEWGRKNHVNLYCFVLVGAEMAGYGEMPGFGIYFWYELLFAKVQWPLLTACSAFNHAIPIVSCLVLFSSTWVGQPYFPTRCKALFSNTFFSRPPVRNGLARACYGRYITLQKRGNQASLWICLFWDMLQPGFVLSSPKLPSL